MMKGFLKEYRVELIALLVAVMGVFLLFEPFQIKVRLLDGISGQYDRLVAWLAFQGEAIVQFLTQLTVTDLLISMLVLGAIGFAGWRVRWRLKYSPSFSSRTCPRCGSRLTHIHRTRFDRFLGKVLFLRIHRYRCTNRACGWSGLRRGRSRLEDSDEELAGEPAP
jgi:hypothetical protein